MREKLKSVADELREDLERCPDLRAQQLIDLDENLATNLESFGKTVTPEQAAQWREMKGQVDELRANAQMLKMRLLYGDESLSSKLDAMHSESSASEENNAAIEVERDAHRAKGISDVFKALLMWKDSPDDRLS